MVSLGEIAFWSLEGGDTLSCLEGNDVFGTHGTCVVQSEQHGVFYHVISLMLVVSSHVHSHGKRNRSNPLTVLF